GNVLAGLSCRVPLYPHRFDAITSCPPPGRDLSAGFGARRIHRLDALALRRRRARECLRRGADFARNLGPPMCQIARDLELDLSDLHPNRLLLADEAREPGREPSRSSAKDRSKGLLLLLASS